MKKSLYPYYPLMLIKTVLMILLFCNTLSAQVNHIVISQVYGGGGNSGSYYQNDFIELFNPTSDTVSLSGHSLQYASSAGTSWQVQLLSGSIAPGRYFLVQEAAGSNPVNPLPTPDISGTIAMGGTSGKVALCSVTTTLTGSCPTGSTIIDFVGYGTANCYEGSGAASGANNTNSVQRHHNGCTDTDQNNTDFFAAMPVPRNSASNRSYCHASKFMIDTIYPASPNAGEGFEMTVIAVDPEGFANIVLNETIFEISTNGNAGSISGTITDTIPEGSNFVVVSGIILPLEGTNVTLMVSHVSGDTLESDTSDLFDVNAVLPVVITSPAATFVTSYSATLEAEMTSHGGNPTASRGFVYDINPLPVINVTPAGTGTGTYSAPITGLSPNTTYYFRAYATNSAGTAYGDEYSFTTINTGINGDNINGNILLLNFSDRLVLDFKNAESEDVVIVMFDAEGKQIIRFDENNPSASVIEIPTAKLAKGLYFISILSGNSNYNFKIIR